MNSQLQYWWARERMKQTHADAARRALVRSLRRPFSLGVAQSLIQLGGRIARRASHRQEERLSAALSRVLEVRYERSEPVYVVQLGHPDEKWPGAG
jgi:hypothetical protein